MATQARVFVNQDSPRAVGDGSFTAAKGTKRGELCIIDFYTQMALEGRGFQVKFGNISAHETGIATITTTTAEGCVDNTAGLTVIPCEVWVSYDLDAGDARECAAKSVGAVSSAGTAFVPLPLLIGGTPAASTARMDDEGGVTVTAETTTNTVRHFHVASEFAMTAGTDADTANPVIWQPVSPPILVGPSCFYLQVGATTTGPQYFAHIDYLELLTVAVS